MARARAAKLNQDRFIPWQKKADHKKFKQKFSLEYRAKSEQKLVQISKIQEIQDFEQKFKNMKRLQGRPPLAIKRQQSFEEDLNN